MPQITVTVDDDVYWDLQNLPKGLKSRFVCLALRHVITWKCDNDAAAMHAWARNKPHSAFAPTENDEKEQPEKPKTALEEWADMQREMYDQ